MSQPKQVGGLHIDWKLPVCASHLMGKMEFTCSTMLEKDKTRFIIVALIKKWLEFGPLNLQIVQKVIGKWYFQTFSNTLLKNIPLFRISQDLDSYRKKRRMWSLRNVYWQKCDTVNVMQKGMRCLSFLSL